MNTKCPACGLSNFDTEPRCRRCGGSLGAAPKPDRAFSLKTLLVVLALIAGGVAASVGGPAIYKQLSRPKLRPLTGDGSFVVVLPGVPEETDTTHEAAGATYVFHLYEVDLGAKGSAMVGFVSYPSALLDVLVAGGDERLLDGATRGVVEQTKLALVSESKITVDGFPARELVLSNPGTETTAIIRIVWGNLRMYMVGVTGEPSSPIFQDRALILDSFHVRLSPSRIIPSYLGCQTIRQCGTGQHCCLSSRQFAAETTTTIGSCVSRECMPLPSEWPPPNDAVRAAPLPKGATP